VLLVGLTGGIGSGKSTVAQMLAERGAVILDADAFARDALARGTSGFEAVVERFGRGVVGPDGELDRAALATRVFSDPQHLRDLEAIVHPVVDRRIAQGIAAQAGTDHVVVVDSPLIVESGRRDMFEVLVVVSASEQTQLRRLELRGLDPADVRRRIASQSSLEEKVAAADVVLDNEGDLPGLERQVGSLWADLTSRARRA
jgi:dephospho-CoA kinase